MKKNETLKCASPKISSHESEKSGQPQRSNPWNEKIGKRRVIL